MLHHAARRADLASTSLSSILQTAASRAWVRTRPVRAFHRSMPARDGAASASASECKGGESSKGRSVEWVSRWSSPTVSCHVEEDVKRKTASSPVEDFLEPIEDTEGCTQICQAGLDASVGQGSSSKPELSSTRASPATQDRPRVPVARTIARRRHAPHGLAGVECFQGYEDDPPWDEVIESMQDAGEPLPIVTYTQPSLPVELRVPTTPDEMYRSLVYLSRPSLTGSTRPLKYLQRYHNAYPELQSTRSYNFLISLFIASGELDTAGHLLQSMHRRDIEDDLETRVLKVRWMVRQGLWGEAWEGQTARGPVPLGVWLEFFGSLNYSGKRVMDVQALQDYLLERGRRPPWIGGAPTQKVTPGSSLRSFDEPSTSTPPPPHATSPEHADGGMVASHPGPGAPETDPPSPPSSLRAGVPSKDRWDADALWFKRQRAEGDHWRRPAPPPPPSLPSELARYEILMGHFPALTAEETARMPPRVMQTLVEWFARTGNRAAAFDATQAYVAGLPARLDDAQRAACLKMIHPQLVPAREGLPGHFRARQTLARLLALHADLRPDATTLVHLVNSLRGTARCGARARELVGLFRRRFGAGVVDDRVRWRLAWLALKQRHVGIARAVFAEHDGAARRERARQHREGLEREFGAARPPAGPPQRPPFHAVFAARGLEQYWVPLWHRLQRIVARAQAKKGAR